jgi:hypothetical protein
MADRRAHTICLRAKNAVDYRRVTVAFKASGARCA